MATPTVAGSAVWGAAQRDQLRGVRRIGSTVWLLEGNACFELTENADVHFGARAEFRYRLASVVTTYASALAPAYRSSGVEYSAALWLIPSLLRTKIMQAGQCSARYIES